MPSGFVRDFTNDWQLTSDLPSTLHILCVPWTYEQFLTKLFVTTPKLSIVNCLRILNFL